jgi:hypothetical protein
MKRAAATITICLVLCGCVSQPPQSTAPTPTVTYKPHNLDKATMAEIQSGVKRGLKDPMSAMFGEMYASTGSDGSLHVCGLVNAKNSFGGYTGDKIFYGLLLYEKGKPSSFALAGMGGTDTDDAIARTLCHNWQLAV